MASYDYFKQYVSEMERIRAKTAHDEHIVEFRALCAKMINDAIPDIRKQCLEEMKQEQHEQEHVEKRQPEEAKVRLNVNVENVKSQILLAIKNAFK